jgi:hypothetical protein
MPGVRRKVSRGRAFSVEGLLNLSILKLKGGRMKTLMLGLLLVASLAFGAETSLACTCAPSKGPAEELELASAVFSGEVVEIRKHKQSGDIFGGVEAVVRVERAWKGVEAATVSVFTAAHSAACGYRFKQGRTYLVYAYKDAEGRLSTGICGRTRRLKDAGEDLKELGAGREVAGGRSK